MLRNLVKINHSVSQEGFYRVKFLLRFYVDEFPSVSPKSLNIEKISKILSSDGEGSSVLQIQKINKCIDKWDRIILTDGFF